MKRRIAGLAAGCCLLLGSVVCGQATKEKDGRAGVNLAELKGAGSIESGGAAMRPRDDGGGVARASAAPVIVIGFVGGFVRHANAVHSPVQVGQRLRKAYPAGVFVEVFENSKREAAHRRILELLDVTRDGKLSEEEKQSARIVIYGMSWGGSETVTLAKELEAQKIPVMLTIQVDSVKKIGEDDGVIPANVAEAANFYQDEGLLHGRPEIRAKDGDRTKILGNFRYDYKAKPLSCKQYPWYDRMLTKYHTEIECDPAVWGRVEELIRGKLAAAEGGRAAGT